MIETTYGITLKVKRSGVVHNAYTYENGRVSGPAWDFTDPLSVEDVKAVRQAITEFIDLVLKNCDYGTDNRQESRLEIQELSEPERIKFDFEVGDLVADMVYDKTENTFTGAQTKFDIVWCDFIAYVRAWDSYLRVVETRDNI